MIYKVETHLHTKESSDCSIVSAEEIIKLYKEKNYKTIIITDHYSLKKLNNAFSDNWDKKIDYLLSGYKKAKKIGDKLNINILFGIELELIETDSEYLIYGITEKFLRKNKHLYNLTLSELVDICKNNNFLLVQAHPFRSGIELIPIEYGLPVEIYNGCCNENSKNEQAVEYAKDNNLIGTSGSDFHCLEDLARGGIITKKEIETIKDFINCILNNDFTIIRT